MDEPIPESATKPKRKYTRHKPADGIQVTVGKRKYRGDTYQITAQFLIVRKGTTSVYIALAGLPAFEVVDSRPADVVRAMPAMSVVPNGPTIAGGPLAVARTQSGNDPEFPSAFVSSQDRNREIAKMMGPFG